MANRKKTAKAPPAVRLGDYLTIGQAAERLGISRSTLRNWDRSGRLIPRRHPLTKFRLYKLEELEQLLRDAEEGLD